eukprot:1158644-Pelagomonas_calceolata.AAC.4
MPDLLVLHLPTSRCSRLTFILLHLTSRCSFKICQPAFSLTCLILKRNHAYQPYGHPCARAIHTNPLGHPCARVMLINPTVDLAQGHA